MVHKKNAYVTSDYVTMKEVISTKYFNGDAPARSCIAADKLPKNVLAEVEAIAIVK